MYTRCYVAVLVLFVTVLVVNGQSDFTCGNDTDCGSPVGVARCNITTGSCTCLKQCYNLSDNTCMLRECHSISDDLECRNGKKSRLTALLLSIFLINFGAANFYIERYDLAAPQLILGLLLCCVQIGACAMVCRHDDDGPTAKCATCCFFNALLSLLFFAWWIADLVIFATNRRDDRNDCPLYE